MEFKVVTYNIDGLPETLDLNDLPWIFKPIVWVYRKWKGTTLIRINDNAGTSERIRSIGKYLSSTEADIIGVQEDFNYHTELIEGLPGYKCATYSGGFDLSNVFSSMTWFPLPRFKADGLNLITKENIKVSSEDIVSWKKSYGYFSHANDKLTHKGFRFYTVNVDGIDIDIYVLHMDADFYNINPDIEGDVKARKNQLRQVVSYILSKDVKRPIIILGDTNSTNKYSWDYENIEENLFNPINNTSGLSIKEATPNNMVDVDRVFYINSSYSKYNLRVKDCFFDKEIFHSDHKPLIATFTIDIR